MADYILVVQLDIPNELEDDFNRAYDKEHVPNLLNVSGVHGCCDGGTKWRHRRMTTSRDTPPCTT